MAQVPVGIPPRLPLPHCLGPSAGSASDKSTSSTKSTNFQHHCSHHSSCPRAGTGNFHLSKAEQLMTLQGVTNAKLSYSGKRNLSEGMAEQRWQQGADREAIVPSSYVSLCCQCLLCQSCHSTQTLKEKVTKKKTNFKAPNYKSTGEH